MRERDTPAARLRTTLDVEATDDGPRTSERLWHLAANTGAMAAMGYSLWCGLDMVVGWPVPALRAFLGLWLVLAVVGVAIATAATVLRAATDRLDAGTHAASASARHADEG